MPPPVHTKPENVLKRAQELMGVGQNLAALNVLYEHVTSKRSRNSPIASLEPVMLLFVELCVELKKGKLAKDGIYQYKNTAQNSNVGTIEVVLKSFIERSSEKVNEAQAKADEVQSSLEPSASTGTNVDDLEASETPESILLSTVSGEQSKDRTDRAIVTPWLKFLWETFRTVLEVLKNNSRLEIMYQTTALQAFTFCQKYTRKTEFRRLCELLRNHVQSSAKYSNQMHAINLSDPDTLQRHLDTRFQQLNVAVELELWQEAFRSIEDIHTLLNLSKRPAKNVMMATYYERLTRIFLVSDNWLYHSGAWSRYFSLLRQSSNIVASGGSKKDNPVVTEADMSRAASFVVLSALSIPIISTSRSRGATFDLDEARKTKNQRLTSLLAMSTAPTRSILLNLSKSLLNRIKPEIKELYTALEVDFHPLSICKRVSPILEKIGSDPEMAKYIPALQQVILTRLFQQLSQVYESVQLDFIYGLAQFPDPFQVTASQIEKFLMNANKKSDLATRLDHASSVLTFDSDVFSSAKALHPGSSSGSAENEGSSVQRLQRTPAEIVRSQLTRLAKTLYICTQYVDPSLNAASQQAKNIALQRAEEGAEQEHQSTLARRAIIEKKKEIASEVAKKKLAEEDTRKRLQAQQLAEKEAERLREEQALRDRKRIQEEQKKAKHDTLIKEVEEMKKHKNFNLDGIDIDELDSDKLRAIRIEQMTKEKSDLNNILKHTGKRIDHLERAFRKEELKLLGDDYKAQKEHDLADYEIAKAESLERAEQKHKEDVALKHRLSRLWPTYEQFRKDLQDRRHDQFDKRRKQADRELENAIQKRKRDLREKRARERREQEEAERREREEEERLAREAEEKAATEAERKRKMAEEKAQRDKQRQELEEKAALQRQREEEAEARIAARKAALSSGAPSRTLPERTGPIPARAEAERPSGPPQLNIAGNKPSWRERQAAKEAAGGSGTSPAPPGDEATTAVPPESARRSGYVPPHLRGRQDGGSQSPNPNTSRDESSGGTEKWRPPRREIPRDGSPADSLVGGRGSSRPPNGTPAPADGSVKPTPGKYVPVHLRNKQ